MIREATQDDFDEICELLKYAYIENKTGEDNGGINYSEPVGRKWLQDNLMLPATGTIIIVEDEDGIQGFVGGVIVPSWWYLGSTAIQLFIYIHPKKRGKGKALLRAFEDWVKQFPQVKQIRAVVEGQKAEVLYKRMGYEQRSVNLFKEV